MKWHGYQVEDTGVEYDPFATLAAQAQAAGQSTASVSYNVGTSMEFGAVKVGVNITLHCPQTEKALDMAGELAFRKGVELTNDGASHLGMPALPTLEDT